jgi:inorganic pyrophosphatase
VYGGWQEITHCPSALIERLKHYFLTYKDAPGALERRCEITHVYGHDEAYEIIQRSREDYAEKFGHPDSQFAALLGR